MRSFGYADYHETLAKEQINIAVPILPVRPNPQVVIDCARAGVKAIYCEKPMAARPMGGAEGEAR